MCVSKHVPNHGVLRSMRGVADCSVRDDCMQKFYLLVRMAGRLEMEKTLVLLRKNSLGGGVFGG